MSDTSQNTYKDDNPVHMTSITGPILQVEVVAAKALSVDPDRVHYLQVHVLFGNDVIRSHQTLCIASNDPVFDYTCSFGLDHVDGVITLHSLLSLDSPVLIYITASGDKHVPKNCVGQGSIRTMVAAAVVDFRYALLHTEDYISVELLACELDGVRMGVGAGVLYARLKLANLPPDVDLTSRPQAQIEEMIWSYQTRLADDNRALYHAARGWWSKVVKDCPHVKERVVKVVAEDELGYHRSVCSLVHPIIPPRSMLNPRFTARFVSLIPYVREVGLVGGRVETWRSAHATLSRLQGDVEDHAILLCSMLLGWGLDAYVALGTVLTSNGADNSDRLEHRPYCWVVTLDASYGGKQNPRVTLWDAVSGVQWEMPHSHPRLEGTHKSPKPHRFGEIHQLFRHNCFLINTQVHCGLANGPSFSRGCSYMSFDLTDSSKFASMPMHVLTTSLTHPGARVSRLLTRSAVLSPHETGALESLLEEGIKERIATQRLSKDLYTHFDDALATTFHIGLSSYEYNKVMGVEISKDDFHASLKGNMKSEETFGGYPSCYNHSNPDAIWSQLSSLSGLQKILFPECSSCRHAVRAKIFSYPEDVMAVWLFVGVIYS